MAFLCIEIDSTNKSVQDLNESLESAENGRQGVQQLINVLTEVLAKTNMANVQATTRTTSAGISTGGSGSTQVAYTLK